MNPGEQTTGTRDEHYNLVSVLYHALHGAENCETYALDAEAAGRADLVTFFREVQVGQVGLAERAKELLGIGGVAPGPGGAATPGLTDEVGTAVPPEGMMGEEVPPETEVVLLVAEVMTPEVVTVEPSASIADAARRMIEEEKKILKSTTSDVQVELTKVLSAKAIVNLQKLIRSVFLEHDAHRAPTDGATMRVGVLDSGQHQHAGGRARLAEFR